MAKANTTPITPIAEQLETDRKTVAGESPEIARALMAASLLPESAPTIAALGAHLAAVERTLFATAKITSPAKEKTRWMPCGRETS